MHTHDTTQAAQVFLIPFIYPALNKHDPDCVKQQNNKNEEPKKTEQADKFKKKHRETQQ